MKENTNTTKKKEKKDQGALYTILDRYLNFCRQAHFDSGNIQVEDKYLERWFVY